MQIDIFSISCEIDFSHNSIDKSILDQVRACAINQEAIIWAHDDSDL